MAIFSKFSVRARVGYSLALGVAVLVTIALLAVFILPTSSAHAGRSKSEVGAGITKLGSSATAARPTPAAANPAVPAPPAATEQRQAAANAAAALATTQGSTSGIAIIDIQTGAVTTAGSATSYFPTESTMKVLIAAQLLLSGQMTGQTESTAYQMITQSDDSDADGLYSSVGGADIEPMMASHYEIDDLGTPPILGSGEWGSTQVTPLGMATFLEKAKNDPTVGPWLTNAMQNMATTAADGTNQVFGLRAADPTAAVKQGWGGDTADQNSEGTPSIGYVDGGRYVIAIYTSHSPEISETAAADLVTQQAQALLPGGQLPPL